jgi:hypothetical protein
MTTSKNKTTASKKTTTGKDLETQMPLSEKDEVKQAERRVSKAVKKS